MNNPIFKPGTLFFDVEGKPVTIGAGAGHGEATPGMYCAAWDALPKLREFPPDSAQRNGAPLSEQQFRDMISRR
jgi:hypothetical protein